MITPRWRTAGLAGLFMVLPAASLLRAQSVSCTGITEWSATTTYAAGAQVTYQGGLYQAQVSTTNVPPNYCSTCGWWQALGTCGTAPTCTAAPSVPTGLAATRVSSTSANLSWNASTAGTGCTVTYNVYQNGVIIVTGLTGTSSAVSGLAASTSYSYTVAAVDAAGSSNQCQAASANPVPLTCGAAPAVPSGLASSAVTSSSVTLSWSPAMVGANCTATYRVYSRGIQILTGLTSPSATVSGLTANTTYSFTVAAVDAAGLSTPSAALAVTTLATPACAAAPAVPTGLASPSQTASSVNLTWSSVTPPANCAVTYRVYSRGIQILTGLTSPSATVSGLTANTTYSLTVAAVDAAGLSAQTAALSVKTLAAATCAVAPAVPTNLASPSQTTSSANLTWSAVTTPANCAVTYRVYSRGIQILTGLTSTSATVSGLTAGSTYSFTVAAADAAGLSAQTAVLSVKIPTTTTCAAAPAVPTGLAASSITTSSANLSWTAVTAPANCTVSYNVYRDGTPIATGLTGTSTAISGLSANTSYALTVTAVDAAGSSAASTALSVKTLPLATCSAAPAVPTGLAASSITSSSVNLTWNAVTAPANCTVSYGVYKNGVAIATGLAATSTTVSGLSANTTYALTVVATNSVGSSAQSQTLLVTTAAGVIVVDPAASTPYFMIVNKYSGKALDLIGGDTSNGARINQWTFDYNGQNQRWAIVPTENHDHFKIISWVSGKCACIDADSMDRGAQLHDWDYVGNNQSQQFDLIDVGNGYFKIRNVKSGKILDDDAFGMRNDNKIQQWDDGNTDNQMWRLQPWGDYFIRATSGRYVCVQGMGNSNGNRIIQYDKQDNPWFKWRFLSEGDGWSGCFSLNALSRVLCVAGSSTQAGQYCNLYDYNPLNGGDQKIRVMPQLDGTFKFYFKFDGQAWEMQGGQVGNDVALDQNTDGGNAWQKFALERVPGSGTTGACITIQPLNQKVTTGSTATFWVAAQAPAAISYQWYRNGAAISGATSAIYTTAVTNSGDNGATFMVTLNCGGTLTTSNTVGLAIDGQIDDLMGRAGGQSWSSATPMGNHFQGRHVTTDADRSYFNDAGNQPPIPSGHESDLHLKAFSVNLFPSGSPSPTDINQHNLGDCNGITALGTMAYMVPEFVKGLISDNGGGVFTVAMFDPQGQPVTLKLDSQFLADGSGNLAAVSGKNDVATWSTVLEKAVMKWNVIYQANSTIEGIGSEHVTPLFTGAGSSFAFDRGALSPAEMTRVIKASLACGKFISGGYGAEITLGNVYSVTGHGYACYWPSNDATMISMRNPWGVNPIINGGGYDGSTDGLLNIPSNTTWSQTIDLRIIDSGIAGTAGRTSPYAPPTQNAPQAVRLSPAVANVKAK